MRHARGHSSLVPYRLAHACRGALQRMPHKLVSHRPWRAVPPGADATGGTRRARAGHSGARLRRARATRSGSYSRERNARRGLGHPGPDPVPTALWTSREARPHWATRSRAPKSATNRTRSNRHGRNTRASTIGRSAAKRNRSYAKPKRGCTANRRRQDRTRFVWVALRLSFPIRTLAVWVTRFWNRQSGGRHRRRGRGARGRRGCRRRRGVDRDRSETLRRMGWRPPDAYRSPFWTVR